jgi:hypothetical protein
MSRWRWRLVRWAVLATFGGLAGAAALAYQLSDSTAVREQVTAHCRKFFAGGDVALGAASFRLLGGVNIQNFTLYRQDDPTRTPVLHVPSGVIYHDKEQLAQGRLAIRKLLMQKPRLTISRTADGRWNVAGLLGPVHPERQIPIVEIEQGTVVLEIAGGASGAQPATPFRVVLHNVNATLLNQPRPVLNIQVHGEAASLGPVHATATWHRTENRLDAVADLAPVPVTIGLIRDLARFCPALAEEVDQVAGTARLHAGVQFAGDGWRHQARLELTGGRLVHRQLPTLLENIELSVRCDDGAVAVERLTAAAGRADVTFACRFREMPAAGKIMSHIGRAPSPPTAIAKTPHPATLIPAALDPLRSMELTIKHLPITPDLFARLPAAFQQYQRVYDPSGAADLTVKLDRTQGRDVLTAKLRPDSMEGRFESFPYRVHEVRGCLDLTLAADRPPRLDVDLTAEANGRRPVTIQGRVEGDGPAPGYSITLGGDSIILDDTLIEAMPAKFRAVARSYRPQGRCDVTARLTRPAGATQPNQQFTVGFRGDATVCYDGFPVPLEHLAGSIDIALGPTANPNQCTWLCTFHDVRAAYAGARVSIAGTARPAGEGTRVDLTIHGRNVPLNDTLAEAFASPKMKLRPVWEMFCPTGRFDFTAEVTHTDRQPAPPDYDIRVRHTGATIKPTFFPLELDDLSGSFRLTQGRVEVNRYTARHGETHFDFGGGVTQFGDGWHYADLYGLRAEPLALDAALVAALPPALQSVCRSLEPTGNVAVELDRLVIDHPAELPGPAQPPVMYWDGRIKFANAALRTGVEWTGVTGVVASKGSYRGQVLEGVTSHVALDSATVFGQPLAGVHADAWVLPNHPHELRLRLGRGSLFGGQMLGEAHVAFGAGLQYEVDLKAIGVRLEEVARHNHIGENAHMSGLAKAELYLTGNGYGMDELGGNGNVHVPDGKMYNLPLVLDLLKVITALHVPDGTAFEEAHAEFKIQGKRVQVQRLDLLGSAISLGGKGEVNLDGSNLTMDFYAVWGHITQILPPGLREIPPWLSKNLMLLHARGKLGGPYVVRPEPLPTVVDPVRQLMEKAAGRMPGVRAQKD